MRTRPVPMLVAACLAAALAACGDDAVEICDKLAECDLLATSEARCSDEVDKLLSDPERSRCVRCVEGLSCGALADGGCVEECPSPDAGR